MCVQCSMLVCCNTDKIISAEVQLYVSSTSTGSSGDRLIDRSMYLCMYVWVLTRWWLLWLARLVQRPDIGLFTWTVIHLHVSLSLSLSLYACLSACVSVCLCVDQTVVMCLSVIFQ